MEHIELQSLRVGETFGPEVPSEVPSFGPEVSQTQSIQCIAMPGRCFNTTFQDVPVGHQHQQHQQHQQQHEERVGEHEEEGKTFAKVINLF